MGDNLNVCQVCSINPSKYKCPKCNLDYCSLNCYKCDSHVKCTENFYRECCMSELQGVKVSEEMKTRMESILTSESNLKEKNSNKANVESLEDRLYDLSLDETDEIWERLNDTEKKEFFNFIKSDEIKKFIKCWKPWWIFSLVEEVDSSTNKRVPKLYKNIISISKMISKSPNKNIRYMIMLCLLSYAYITRRYNGDHHNFTDEICDILQEVCPNLFNNNPITFDSMNDVIGSFIFHASDAKLQLNNEFLLLLIDDLDHFLRAEETNRRFISAALSDLRVLLRNADDNFKYACKKIEFYLSWVSTCSEFQSLIQDLKKELQIAMVANFRLK